MKQMLAFLCCCLMPLAAASAADHLIYKGSDFSVYAERTVYTREGSEQFFIRFTIENTSGRTLGIDNSQYKRLIYPASWQVSKTASAVPADEKLLVPDSLAAGTEIIMKRKFTGRKLLIIDAGQKYTYYQEFTGITAADLAAASGQYLVTGFDGQFFYTDGTKVLQVALTGVKPEMRRFALKSPVAVTAVF